MIYIAILAHNHPEHFHRLCDKLEHCEIQIIAHIDAKTDLSLFYREDVLFTQKRFDCKWGHISIVHAEVELMRMCKAIDKSDNYKFVLVSGSDYVMTSTENIVNMLHKNMNACHVNLWKFPVEQWNGGLYRIYDYTFFDVLEGDRNYVIMAPIYSERFKLQVNNRPQKFMDANSGYWDCIFKHRDILSKERVHPDFCTPCAGDQFFAINKLMLDFVLASLDERPDFLEYHEYTFAPDELALQSIIAGYASILKIDLEDMVTYVKREYLDNKWPIPMSFADVYCKLNRFCFARKFDLDKTDVLAYVDARLNNTHVPLYDLLIGE